MNRPLVVGTGEVLWDMLPGGKQLGGAPANFAYHAAALGARGAVVSRVGDDHLGHEILSRLDALGIDRRHVSVDRDHPTGTVDVRVDARGVPEYVIHEDVAWDFLAADDALLDLAGRADAVCFGTLAQRAAASRETIAAFIRATRADCLRVFDINLRQSYYDRDVIHHTLLRSNVLKLNEEEVDVVRQRLDLWHPSLVDVESTVDALLKKYPLGLVAVTRGTNGSLLCASDGRWSDHDGFAAEPLADTVGAGDAFTAALAMGLLAGHDLDRINAAANRLAAYVCTQPGATPPIPDSIVAELAAR